MRRWLFWLPPLLALACSSPLHAKDPTIESALTKACELLGDQRRAAIDEQAKRAGISLDDAEKAFKLACAARLLTGLPEAGQAGLVGVAAARDTDGGAP